MLADGSMEFELILNYARKINMLTKLIEMETIACLTGIY